nr:EOG090X06HD [Triops cancriformis]
MVRVSLACFNFWCNIKLGIQLVQSYENPLLQQKALSYIPISRLLERAGANIEGDSSRLLHCPALLREAFLEELLIWFKTEFFTWFSPPNCRICHQVMAHQGSVPPSMEDKLWGAERVENYACLSCPASSHRFPRYNRPEKLLETRTGRCGEWANCFTLLCRSLGWDTRYVLDWTDHVWTEIFLENKQRWIHCDSCEAMYDKPLLYEKGWGKQLTYVLAFSKDHVQDVTWRYSAQYKELLKRRIEVSENWLLEKCTSLTSQLQANTTELMKKQFTLRLLKELCEFIMPNVSSQDENLPGRISGDVEWRSARGETGSAEVAAYTWRPTPEEMQRGFLHISYSSAMDYYIRHADGSRVIKWQKGVYKYECIDRKVEYDWKMAYLARTEGAAMGSITWRVDVAECGKTIGQVRLVYPYTLYDNASIQWRLCADEKCEILPSGQTQFICDSLRGTKNLTVTAVLNGGQGNIAWQHAQIARQNLQDPLYTLSLVQMDSFISGSLTTVKIMKSCLYKIVLENYTGKSVGHWEPEYLPSFFP